MSRKVGISVVDDATRTLDSVVSSLSYVLNDLDVTFYKHLVSHDNISSLPEQIADNCPNVILMDYHLVRGRDTGLELALTMKEIFPTSQIILMSVFDKGEKENLTSLLRKITHTATKIADRTIVDFWDKGDPVEQLEEKIRSNLFQPLIIGVEGAGGQMGVRIIQELYGFLRQDKSTSPVAKILFNTVHRKKQNIYELFETSSNNPQFVGLDSFDEFNNVDLLILAGSTVRGRDVPRLQEDHYRRGLLKFEYRKFTEYAEKMARFTNFPLIATTTNPIPEILELLRRKGVSPEKLCSPFEPDTTRLIDSYNIIRQESEIRERYPNLSSLSAPDNERIVGVHGCPQVIIPKNFVDNKEYVMLVQMAERNAEEIALKSQQAAVETGLPFYVPQQTIVASYIDSLAHFKQLPVNCHCFYSVKGDCKTYKGFAALPARIFWKKGLSIFPDKKVIEDTQKKALDRVLFPVIRMQEAFVNNCAPAEYNSG